MQIFMAWPKALGITPWFDREWLTDDHAALVALFGPTARAPRSDFEMAGFLGSEDGVGPLLHLIGEVFGPRDRHGAGPAPCRCRNGLPGGGRRKLPRRRQASIRRWPMWRRCMAAARSGARRAG
jgi:hypothetical protein